jgi:ribonuclease III
VALTRDGPDHQPVFTVEVRLASGPAAQAQGTTKRQAEQAAAAQLLQQVGG